MCEDQVSKLKVRIEHTHRLEAMMCQTGVPWQHCLAPNVDDWWELRTQLVVFSCESGGRMLTSLELQYLPGECLRVKQSAEARVASVQKWVSRLLGGSSSVFLAAEKTYQRCDCRLVVALVELTEVDFPMVWASKEDLIQAHSPLLGVFLVVCARVESFQASPHDLGPMQIVKRHVLVNKPSKEVADEAGWRAGKIPVRKLAPETHGAVNTANRCRAIAKLDSHQEKLRQVIKEAEVDHPAYDWLQETAERMVPVSVADFAPSLLEQ